MLPEIGARLLGGLLCIVVIILVMGTSGMGYASPAITLPAPAMGQLAAMPVSAGHVVVGVILHFAFSAFLGVLFFAVIAGADWFLPALKPGGADGSPASLEEPSAMSSTAGRCFRRPIP